MQKKPLTKVQAIIFLTFFECLFVMMSTPANFLLTLLLSLPVYLLAVKLILKYDLKIYSLSPFDTNLDNYDRMNKTVFLGLHTPSRRRSVYGH